MDRKQIVVQRAREYFAERLDDVIHMVRQDRQEMRGWEEPAHIRAVARRAVGEEGSRAATDVSAGPAREDADMGRTAGEPDRGQQREAVGQLLELGGNALGKISHGTTDMTAEESLGLECVLLLYARPAVAMCDGRLGNVSSFWNLLEDQRTEIEMTQRGVGRIEMLGHPEYDWAGTGFLVGETTLMTTRRTAEVFSENSSGQWQFRPGITAWMDFHSEYQRVASAGCRVCSVRLVHDSYDLAILEVEPAQPDGFVPVPLALAAKAPEHLEGRPAYLIGYPIRDSRRNEPERIARIFRDVYNVKRVQPGNLRGMMQFREVQLLQHDCAPLGGNSGACIIDLETHQVLGVHLCSRYLETSTAIPLWVLHEDPSLERAGVTFAQATREDQETATSQLDAWPEVATGSKRASTIDRLHQRAFGKS